MKEDEGKGLDEGVRYRIGNEVRCGIGNRGEGNGRRSRRNTGRCWAETSYKEEEMGIVSIKANDSVEDKNSRDPPKRQRNKATMILSFRKSPSPSSSNFLGDCPQKSKGKITQEFSEESGCPIEKGRENAGLI